MTYPNPVYRVDGDTIPAQDHNSTAERAVWRFATLTERDATNPTPLAGDVCYVIETNRAYVWGGQPAAWQPFELETEPTELVGYRQLGTDSGETIPDGGNSDIFQQAGNEGDWPRLTIPSEWGTDTEAVLWGGVTLQKPLAGAGTFSMAGNVGSVLSDPDRARVSIDDLAPRYGSASIVFPRFGLTGTVLFDLRVNVDGQAMTVSDAWIRYMVRRT